MIVDILNRYLSFIFGKNDFSFHKATQMCKYKLIQHYRNHVLESKKDIMTLVLEYKSLTHSLGWYLKQFEQLFVQKDINVETYKKYKKSFEKNIVSTLRKIICSRLDATIYLRYCDKGHWTYLKLLMYWLDNLERAHMTSYLMQNTIHEMYESVVLRVRPPNLHKRRLIKSLSEK